MTNSSKVFLVFLIVLVGGAFYAFNQWNVGGSDTTELASEPVTVTIPDGTSARDVSQLLEDSRVIGSASSFTAFTAADGRSSDIKAGTYELDPATSNQEILDIIVAGQAGPPTFAVTIPEGLTVEQTLTRIADAEGSPFTVEQLREGLGLVALPAWVPTDLELPEGGEAFEGLLFPETYEFTIEATPADVLTRLITQTDEVMSAVGAASRNELDLYDTLILASLIEREAQVADERPVISSVIHNRLEQGMALQIDATVVYGILVETGERKERLLNEDLLFVSPWSTYTNAGLPPTPISGSGTASIEAAAAPSETDFFYYVGLEDDSGEHRFSQTLEEHNQAIAEIRGG